MNPSGHYEPFPLQGGYPGQPAGPSVVQHTVVNISEPPKDHIIWSICTLFYGNPCCLGLAALIYSVKARDRKMVGDLYSARGYGTTAFRINTAAVILICLIFFLIIISVSVSVASASNRN
ncbi:dispanin subfamily A member 2b-like [Sphaeramia orbicularis]|uniref:Dispanin subfamily A member 2b-like n=1 Tax=Sphaeramia orbicularis TaxID=375764 RepID=A0A673ANM5_9TELE|nr:dispanin subfamily A member 2b-like [Sphaeramia orbicularis]XP_029993419.1 dispanin subfamily A member 2b-like [Sphaeramia orbicularis]